MIKRFVFSLVLFLLMAVVFFDWQFREALEPNWGLNFSITKTQYLGLDWKAALQEIFTDLKPKRLRIMALWETVEPGRNQFEFGDLEYLLAEAQKRGIKVIVSLGHKQPGWPECHHPAWYEENMTDYQREEAQLNMVRETVLRLKKFNSVGSWQVENEPFFVFGPDCGAVSKELLAREIALVRSLDPRPIVLSDSGEKSFWLYTARFGADIFGSTMYRKIYHHQRKKYVEYLVPPLWYRIKGGMLKYFLDIDRVIGVELQAEPWFKTDVYETPWEEQKKLMNGQTLRENADYARKAGFAENYFWGVEWWYYGKQVKGDDELWQAAKLIFSE